MSQGEGTEAVGVQRVSDVAPGLLHLTLLTGFDHDSIASEYATDDDGSHQVVEGVAAGERVSKVLP